MAGCVDENSLPPPDVEPTVVAEWTHALPAADAERYTSMALDCVHREYPNKPALVVSGPEDLGSPKERTPAFYGCFDWHSAVHGHWLLARTSRRFPDAPWAPRARAALARSLTAENVTAELRTIDRPDRLGFERPYGLAWLLALTTELREHDSASTRALADTLAPLAQLAARRLAEWIPKLSHPIRAGEHSQTAFALGLALDYARAGETDPKLAAIIEEHARRFYGQDRSCPLHMEPSGHDFLSPCLGAADLMRRVLPPDQFAEWLGRSLPTIPSNGFAGWLPVAAATDRHDGKLVHLDGLNLSRAWMLDGIESGLPEKDLRRAALRAAAQSHAEAGLASVSADDYAGGHWLASFAVYLVTRRGRPAS